MSPGALDRKHCGGPGHYISRGPQSAQNKIRVCVVWNVVAFAQPIEQTINMSIDQSIDASHHRAYINQASDRPINRSIDQSIDQANNQGKSNEITSSKHKVTYSKLK